MSRDEQNNSKTASANESYSGVEPAGEQKRLESLLLENGGDVEAEVKKLSGRWFLRPGYLFLLLFFCLSFAGIGYFYLDNTLVKKKPSSPLSHYTSPRQSIPARPEVMTDTFAVEEAVKAPSDTVKTSVTLSETSNSAVAPPQKNDVLLFDVKVGPFIGKNELAQAISTLKQLGFQPEESRSSGPVRMIRLQQGIYPEDEARTQLKKLQQKVESAFILPAEEGMLAVYAGSFHREEGARELQDELAREQIDVSLVETEVVMTGTMLTVLQADQQTARGVADHIATFGFHTRIEKKK